MNKFWISLISGILITAGIIGIGLMIIGGMVQYS